MRDSQTIVIFQSRSSVEVHDLYSSLLFVKSIALWACNCVVQLTTCVAATCVAATCVAGLFCFCVVEVRCGALWRDVVSNVFDFRCVAVLRCDALRAFFDLNV